MSVINKRRNSPWRGVGIQDDGVNVVQAAAAPIDIGAFNSDVPYTVKFGETLITISTKMYGTPFMWQFLCDRNNIDYPLDVVAGDRIIIPEAPVLALINGERPG